MGFLIGLLTVVMVLDCVVLIFLVLIQLPKKEAGMGLAFGGAATDALFGAGSGNVLTKITKYAAATFFILAVLLSVMQRYHYRRTTSVFQQQLQQSSPAPGMPMTTPQPPTAPPPSQMPAGIQGTNVVPVARPAVEDTNLPVPIPPVLPPAAAPKR